MNDILGRRHLAVTALSLQKVRSKTLSLLVVAAMLSTLPLPVVRAADKEATYAEMQALGAQIQPGPS